MGAISSVLVSDPADASGKEADATKVPFSTRLAVIAVFSALIAVGTSVLSIHLPPPLYEDHDGSCDIPRAQRTLGPVDSFLHGLRLEDSSGRLTTWPSSEAGLRYTRSG